MPIKGIAVIFWRTQKLIRKGASMFWKVDWTYFPPRNIE